MKKKLTLKQKRGLSLLSAYLLSMGVPVLTAVFAFPPEIVEGTQTSVGMTLILTAVISISVFRKQIKNAFNTASVVGTWAIMLVICIIAKFFVDQMLVISVVGLVSNAGSVPLFKIADNTKVEMEKQKEQIQLLELKEALNEKQ